MRQQIEKLIIKLACPRRSLSRNDTYPIVLGDVLKKIYSADIFFLDPRGNMLKRFVLVWLRCGIAKSLQEILKETEFKKICPDCSESDHDCNSETANEIPKQKTYLDFWTFILSLNLTKS